MLITAAQIFHKKVGGLASGNIYYESHTWAELQENIPFFVVGYLISFVLILGYQLICQKKEMICSECEKPFISYKRVKESYCPSCNGKGILIKGYFEPKEIKKP